MIAFAGAAEGLHHRIAHAQPDHIFAQRADINHLRRLDFHQHAALEINAQIEALDRDGDDRNQQQDAVNREGKIAKADKINVGGFGDESQQRHDGLSGI